MPKFGERPLLVVIGPTASGKTSLGVLLAKELNGEVVSADSMQIYHGMEVGTARPTEEEMQGIPHHLMGFLTPGERFSVAEYAVLARKTIDEIHARGKLPILVGGTGLYVKAIVDNIQYDGEALTDPALRERFRALAEEKGNEAVWEELKRLDPETAGSLHPNNLGRVIRALEVIKKTGKSIREQVAASRTEPCPYRVLQLGLNFKDRETLYRRIDRRVDTMLEEGLLLEARRLYEMGLSGTAGQAIGYKEFAPYFRGESSLEQAIDSLKRETRRYAKRQLTWFGRDERIHWIVSDALLLGETVRKTAFSIIKEEWGSGDEE